LSMNLYDLFHETARRLPHQPAIIASGSARTYSYQELDEAVSQVSERLRAAGVAPGDSVALHFPSSTEYIVLTYAVWRLGGCVIPLATELATPEKQEVCRCLAIDKIITTERGAELFASFRTGEEAQLVGDAQVFAVQSVRERPAGLSTLNPAFIRFSSGTTGTAKGVVLSHETVLERITAANEVLALGSQDRVLWVLSMAYHFTASIVAYLTYGATIILPANHFAGAIVDAVREHQASLIYASPTHYALLAEYPGAGPLPSLRLAISTTSALNAQVTALFQARYGLPVGQALGIIEVGLPCIDTGGADEHGGSVGRVLPAYELHLHDAGLGADALEILLRGPGMLDAYYQPWQTRAEILDDGWFRTGDVGRLDSAGYLYLTGRTKDVISVMGMKFFPQDVERVLAAHPEVAAASVYAGRDDRWGGTVQARVVPNKGAKHDDLISRLQAYCHQRLASYKIPKQIELVAALPRTASGKILHRPV
jgi:long-chain acyl-CoA synthetase